MTAAERQRLYRARQKSRKEFAALEQLLKDKAKTNREENSNVSSWSSVETRSNIDFSFHDGKPSRSLSESDAKLRSRKEMDRERLEGRKRLKEEKRLSDKQEVAEKNEQEDERKILEKNERGEEIE